MATNQLTCCLLPTILLWRQPSNNCELPHLDTRQDCGKNPIRRSALPQKSLLDRVSTGSGSDLVKLWHSRIVRKYRMLITDQVATAPCTDPVQVRFLFLRQSLVDRTEKLNTCNEVSPDI